MKILAIDTSALVATAALCEDDTPIAVSSQKSGLTHSATMLPIVKNIMDNTNTSIDDIDMFAVSEGPGSFTGIRIGIATVKGLAFGKNKICIGVSTLEALAENLPYEDGILCPVMDARRNQVYNALFKRENGVLVRMCEDRLIPLDELSAELSALQQKIYLCGDGYRLAKSRLTVSSEDVSPLLIAQNAISVASVAKRIYDAAPDEDYSEGKLQPIYLRASQAERERLEKEAEKENK